MPVTGLRGRPLWALLVAGCSCLLLASGAPRSFSLRNRRPESCREQLPRRHEDLAKIVLVGRVLELTPAGSDHRALVGVSRLLRGPPSLGPGSSIVVDGLSDASVATQNCPNNVRLNDTLILLLEPKTASPVVTYVIQSATSGVFPMNLNNLERISALASDEIQKRRPEIKDILCEAHYCAYGRCRVDDQSRTSCHCPDACEPSISPVCGSDNTTYQNECYLIVEGCRRQRPLFVTKEQAC